MWYLDQNTIISMIGKGKIRLFHPFYRRNIITSINFIEILDILIEGSSEEKLSSNYKGKFYFSNATEFTIWNCMYDNPDNMKINWEYLGKEIFLGELLKLLHKNYFITDKFEKNYYLGKKNVFDRMKGNLHEQIATEAVYKKESIDSWWVKQKYSDNGNETKQTPYKYVQDNFLEGYFKDNIKNCNVLEIGCGNGYYSKKMAKYAEKVLGIDYNEKYIKSAIEITKKVKNIFFAQVDISACTTSKIIKEKFKYIFLIDIFLFLFDSKFQKNLYENRYNIFKNIVSLLDTEGKIVIMDPHLFWLTSQIGTKKNPIGIMTEYRYKSFGVTPTLEQASDIFYKSGLSIRRLIEPNIDKSYYNENKARYNYIEQFPQWIIYELEHNYK